MGTLITFKKLQGWFIKTPPHPHQCCRRDVVRRAARDLRTRSSGSAMPDMSITFWALGVISYCRPLFHGSVYVCAHTCRVTQSAHRACLRGSRFPSLFLPTSRSLLIQSRECYPVRCTCDCEQDRHEVLRLSFRVSWERCVRTDDTCFESSTELKSLHGINFSRPP